MKSIDADSFGQVVLYGMSYRIKMWHEALKGGVLHAGKKF